MDSPDKHNLIVDLNVAEWEGSRAKKIYSCVVLMLLAFAQTSSQWERNIVVPAYNYPSNSTKYTLKGEIITNSKEYANITGLYFNLTLIIFALVAGLVIEKLSRRLLVSLATVGVSACVLGMGFGQDYTQFVALRIV